MNWQVQEAKQRLSELLRRVAEEGPQTITRHGEEIAVVVDIAWYRQATEGEGLVEYLMRPHDEAFAEALDEVVAERARDLPRDVSHLFEETTSDHS